MEYFNYIAGGASILSLLITCFVANQVIKISSTISQSSRNQGNKIDQKANKAKGDVNQAGGNINAK